MTVRQVAYFSAGYPRVTDAFITREMTGVEACGIAVHSFAVRAPGDDKITGPEQQAERDRTTYLLGRNPADYPRALAAAARRWPRGFASASKLARETRRVGVEGGVRQGAYLVEAAVLALELADRGIDHLHNHFADSSCTVAMLASEICGIPFSFTIHGPAIFFEPAEWSLDHKLARAEFVAAISAFAKSQLSIYGDPDHWDRIHIVHCGVEDLQPMEAERDESRLELLFVGRLEPVKGIAVLFDAVASMVAAGTNVRLTVAGDGSIRSRLETRAAELRLGDAVRFVGYRSQPQIRQHLAESDALVLPSFNEGVPVALMEAMSQERAVVATSVGGVTELVKDGENGLVVRPGDPDELARALTVLARDPELRRRMGVEGRRFVRAEFDSLTEARRLVTLFRDAPSQRGVLRPEPAPLAADHT